MKIKNVKLKQLKNKQEEKHLKKLQEEEKHVEHEELIAELIAAHKRRRSEIIRTVKTLDQLTKALNREGSNLKRSSRTTVSFPKMKEQENGNKRHDQRFGRIG